MFFSHYFEVSPGICVNRIGCKVRPKSTSHPFCSVCYYWTGDEVLDKINSLGAPTFFLMDPNDSLSRFATVLCDSSASGIVALVNTALCLSEIFERWIKPHDPCAESKNSPKCFAHSHSLFFSIAQRVVHGWGVFAKLVVMNNALMLKGWQLPSLYLWAVFPKMHLEQSVRMQAFAFSFSSLADVFAEDLQKQGILKRSSVLMFQSQQITGPLSEFQPMRRELQNVFLRCKYYSFET